MSSGDISPLPRCPLTRCPLPRCRCVYSDSNSNIHAIIKDIGRGFIITNIHKISMEWDMSTKHQNSLTLIRFVPVEIVRKILEDKTRLETEETREYYNKQMSVFNMDNYYSWYTYDSQLSQVILSLKKLNTPGSGE